MGFYLLGGRGDMLVSCQVRHGMCQPMECDKVVCDDFIYPLLDWSCAPWTAVGYILGGVLFAVPFTQLCWWALYKLRMWVSGRCGSARFSEETLEPVGIC